MGLSRRELNGIGGCRKGIARISKLPFVQASYPPLHSPGSGWAGPEKRWLSFDFHAVGSSTISNLARRTEHKRRKGGYAREPKGSGGEDA
jgi:hypothetical protein